MVDVMWLKEIWYFFLACYLSTTGCVEEKYVGLETSGGSFWKWHIAREWRSGSCKAWRDCVLWCCQTKAAQQVCFFFLLFCFPWILNLQKYIRECSKFKDPVSFKASCFGHAKEFPSLMLILIDWQLNWKAFLTQFCWNFLFLWFKRLQIAHTKWIQVRHPTVVEIAKHEIAILFLQLMLTMCLLRCLLVQGRSSNEWSLSLQVSCSLSKD